MVWRYCRVNDTFKSIYEHWAGNEEKSLGEVTNQSSHCLVMLQFFPPFLFMRYLFCHILAMKTVAMENTQRSRHGERSSSWQLRVFTNRLQFSRRQCKGTKGERAENVRCELAQISINKEGPWGWLKNGRKNNFIVERVCQLTVTMTQPERLGGVLSVLWGERAPHQTCTTRVKVGDCVPASKVLTSTWYILQKWPPALDGLLQSGHLIRGRARWYFNVNPRDFYLRLKLEAYWSFLFLRNILTCMTALKKQVFPRLFMPLTGTKVLLTAVTLPLGGSL